MDAKQLKPYTFWIVCGVIVVIELGLVLFWPITDENGKTPEEVKTQLDTDFKKLTDLHTRAGNTPTGVFDAENPKDIKRLTEEYLLTPKWKGVLQPHVDKYNQQLGAIRKDLATRSSILHEPVADSGDLFAWYNAYVGKTKEVMIALRNAKALIVDETNKEDTDFENGSRIRAQVGFFTKVEMTPPASEHPVLTARFRVLQKISDALIASGSTALPNPAVKTGREADLETKRPASFAAAGVEWKRSGDPTKTLSAPFSDVADAHELVLTLEGSTSALVSAEAAIEAISDPVMIVVGGALTARGEKPAGVRKNVADEPMILKLTITVLDFTRILTAANEPTAGGTAQ
jgi:hypothetical protein